MHKPFYASGFLYNLKTQQILLLKPQNDTSHQHWSTLGGDGLENEEAHEAFQRIVEEFFTIELKPKKIYPVYDYFHDELEKDNFVFYSEVGNLKFDPVKEAMIAWVTFHETLKLLFSSHTKRDLMIAERVINLKERQEDAKREEQAAV